MDIDGWIFMDETEGNLVKPVAISCLSMINVLTYAKLVKTNKTNLRKWPKNFDLGTVLTEIDRDRPRSSRIDRWILVDLCRYIYGRGDLYC